MKFEVIIIVFFTNFTLVDSQPLFQKTIGGLGGDVGAAIIHTSDGGYALTGSTSSYGVGVTDVYFVKLDANFNISWTRTIGGPFSDFGQGLIQTLDGGYAITGGTNSFGQGGLDVYVVKLDSIGGLQWTRTIGGTSEEVGYSIIQTTDSNYIIAGFTFSFGQGAGDAYVVKLDKNGTLLWTRTVGGPNDELSYSMTKTKDDGFVIAGRTSSFAVNAYYDMYIAKFDNNGNLQWTRTVGGPASDEAYSIIQTSDQGIIVVGNFNDSLGGRPNVYVTKWNSLGTLQWTRTIGGIEGDIGYSIIQTFDGGFAIAGEIENYGTTWDFDVYIIKLDSIGNPTWATKIGGVSDDAGFSIIESDNGSYVGVGRTQSFGTGNNDIYLFQLDSTGNTCNSIIAPEIKDTGGTPGTGGAIDSGGVLGSGGILGMGGGIMTSICLIDYVKNPSEDNNINLFPNPTNGIVHFDSDIFPNFEINVYNTLGEKIMESKLDQKISNSNQQFAMDISQLPNGFYVVQVNNGLNIFSKIIFLVK